MRDSSEPTESPENAALIERVARQLRAPVQLGAGFDERLLTAVRAEASAAQPRPSIREARWWTAPRPVRVSPLAGLALAAAFAGAAVLVGRASAPHRAPDAATIRASVASSEHLSVRPAAAETVQIVRFVFVDSTARSVALVGDFNAWTRGATPLASNGASGFWSVTVPLTPGRHEYAFIVNGKRWTPDPFAQTSHDDFDTPSSVLQVGRGDVASSS